MKFLAYLAWNHNPLGNWHLKWIFFFTHFCCSWLDFHSYTKKGSLTSKRIFLLVFALKRKKKSQISYLDGRGELQEGNVMRLAVRIILGVVDDLRDGASHNSGLLVRWQIVLCQSHRYFAGIENLCVEKVHFHSILLDRNLRVMKTRLKILTSLWTSSEFPIQTLVRTWVQWPAVRT